MNERRSLFATYAPMLLAVLLTGGSAYVINREEISESKSKLINIERKLEKQNDRVRKNSTDIAMLIERSACLKQERKITD